MSKLKIGFFIVLCCSALITNGCAKKELMKEGEGIPAASTVKPTEAKPSVKEEAVQEQAVKEAPAAIKEETTSAGQLQGMLNTIYFDFDSFVLSAASRETLSKNAGVLKKNSSANVQIQGNCDERGSDEYNLALGEKRAKAAMSYLLTMGVPANNLSVISYGKEKPADPGHDEAAWAKNRRDDFVVTK